MLLVLDAAYAEYVRRNDYESGIELVATTDNVVMTRTFSKIYGLAALRLGWMYGPAHVVDAINRIRGPFNVNAPAIAAGIAAIRDTAHVERSREHNTRWLAWLTEEIGKLGLTVTPSVANFVLIHFPETQGPHRQGRRRLPDQARPDPAPGRRLQAAECLAHDRRHRRGQPAGGQGARGVLGEAGVSKPAPLFNRLALIGVGLIGSSIARAARAQGAARSIVATARSPRRASAWPNSASPIRWWKPMPPRSKAPISSSSAFRSAPAARWPRRSARISRPAPSSPMSARSKARSCATWRPHLPKSVHFVPAHPVAGTEYSGPDAGFAELFVNRWCILTPPEGTDAKAVEKLAAFWRLLGANVETMAADHHDLVLAVTSHLPHLIAYTIVGTADELQTVTRSEVLKFSAGGFRDFTRIAASDPTMWRDVFLANKDAVLEMLGRFNEDISALTKAIRNGDGDALFEHFTRTRAIRKGIVEIGQDSAAPDFGRPHPDLPHEPLPKPYAAED